MNQFKLKNTIAVVTGGGTGIGKETTRILCEAGCKTIIASRKKENMDPTKKEFNDLGFNVETYQLDITKPEKVEEFAKFVDETYNRLDVLVNNAGGNFIAPTRKLSVNGWLAVININLNGTFYCSKFLGEVMVKARNGGSIVNLVATYGWTGAPGNIHSSASKAGVIALTKTLATEWAQYGIRVNAIAPGPIDTPIASEHLSFKKPIIYKRLIDDIPIRRLGKAEEIAKSVLYLASPFWSSYVTGEVLIADGGHWLFKGIDPHIYLENE